jgi:hypothetical protein
VAFLNGVSYLVVGFISLLCFYWCVSFVPSASANYIRLGKPAIMPHWCFELTALG